nr:MAG TPA: hypothetical protein [Caudoviricetes sp.]
MWINGMQTGIRLIRLSRKTGTMQILMPQIPMPTQMG